MSPDDLVKEAKRLQEAKPLAERLQRQVERLNRLREAGLLVEPQPHAPIDLRAREGAVLWRGRL